MTIKCPKCQADNTDTARFCSNCATPLTPGGQPAAALTKTLESPAYVLTKGSLVAGKYRVLEEIGRGGMGVVYEAEKEARRQKKGLWLMPQPIPPWEYRRLHMRRVQAGLKSTQEVIEKPPPLFYGIKS